MPVATPQKKLFFLCSSQILRGGSLMSSSSNHNWMFTVPVLWSSFSGNHIFIKFQSAISLYLGNSVPQHSTSSSALPFSLLPFPWCSTSIEGSSRDVVLKHECNKSVLNFIPFHPSMFQEAKLISDFDNNLQFLMSTSKVATKCDISVNYWRLSETLANRCKVEWTGPQTQKFVYKLWPTWTLQETQALILSPSFHLWTQTTS